MVLRCATCAPTTSSSWTLWRHSNRRRCAAKPGQRAAGMDLEQPGWFLFRWRLVYKCGYPKNAWFIMENPLLCFFQFLSCLLKMVSYAFSFQCFKGWLRASNGWQWLFDGFNLEDDKRRFLRCALRLRRLCWGDATSLVTGWWFGTWILFFKQQITSPFSMGKSTINGLFSIAMLNYQRVLGMSSSQLTNPYFSEGLAQPPGEDWQWLEDGSSPTTKSTSLPFITA